KILFGFRLAARSCRGVVREMSDVLPARAVRCVRPGTGEEGGVAQRPAVTVLGSLNTDISLLVPHLPGPGETVLTSAGATVGAGGNGLAGDTEVAAAFAEPCDALVLSAEIPVGVLAAAVRRARADGVRTVLNLAPVPEGAAGLLAERPDWLVVNAQEAAALA